MGNALTGARTAVEVVLWPMFFLACWVAVPGEKDKVKNKLFQMLNTKTMTVTNIQARLYTFLTHLATLHLEHFILGSKMWQFKQCSRTAGGSVEGIAAANLAPDDDDQHSKALEKLAALCMQRMCALVLERLSTNIQSLSEQAE